MKQVLLGIMDEDTQCFVKGQKVWIMLLTGTPSCEVIGRYKEWGVYTKEWIDKNKLLKMETIDTTDVFYNKLVQVEKGDTIMLGTQVYCVELTLDVDGYRSKTTASTIKKDNAKTIAVTEPLGGKVQISKNIIEKPIRYIYNNPTFYKYYYFTTDSSKLDEGRVVLGNKLSEDFRELTMIPVKIMQDYLDAGLATVNK